MTWTVGSTRGCWWVRLRFALSSSCRAVPRQPFACHADDSPLPLFFSTPDHIPTSIFPSSCGHSAASASHCSIHPLHQTCTNPPIHPPGRSRCQRQCPRRPLRSRPGAIRPPNHPQNFHHLARQLPAEDLHREQAADVFGRLSHAVVRGTGGGFEFLGYRGVVCKVRG